MKKSLYCWFGGIVALLINPIYAQPRYSAISTDTSRDAVTIKIKTPKKTTIFKNIPTIQDFYAEKQSHVINNKAFFIAIQEHPSRLHTLGRGRCESQTEVWGYLYQIKMKEIELKNRFLLESCIKEIFVSLKTEADDIPKRYFHAIKWNNSGFAVHWDTGEAEQVVSQKYSTIFGLNEDEVHIESMPTSVYNHFYGHTSE